MRFLKQELKLFSLEMVWYLSPPGFHVTVGQLNEKTYLWVELGLQTIHERTASLINRGHDYQTYLDGMERLRKHNIRVCSHMILGLPGETKEDMMDTARAVADLPVQGIKIHLLHLLKYTRLLNLWEQGGLQFLEKEQYIRLVVDILEILPPDMVIHRLTGDGPPDILIGPMWSLDKWGVLNGIDAELERRNTWQGRLWTPNKRGNPANSCPICRPILSNCRCLRRLFYEPEPE